MGGKGGNSQPMYVPAPPPAPTPLPPAPTIADDDVANAVDNEQLRRSRMNMPQEEDNTRGRYLADQRLSLNNSSEESATKRPTLLGG